MTTVYEALFNYAQDQKNLTRWLLRTDDVQEYHRCAAQADEQEQKLRELLDKPGRALLLGYINNADVRAAYDRQMLFCQGLAMGLELGLWVQTDSGAVQ